MNVSFIGCPCSGKTTTAAMVFAKLKESGLPVEFVPEYARQHIARKRLLLGLRPEDRLSLTDEDQIHIMTMQSDLEFTMSSVCGPDVTVISDTWALSAMLYMTEAARENHVVKLLVENRIKPLADLVFYAPPVSQQFLLDPNRVHDEQQSLKIDAEIPVILKKYMPGLSVIPLQGSADLRAAQVRSTILAKFSTRP